MISSSAHVHWLGIPEEGAAEQLNSSKYLGKWQREGVSEVYGLIL